jgi:hypothetical protein
MHIAVFRFTGPLPDLSPLSDPNLALLSDAQWLRDNPEAVARVRVSQDDCGANKRTLLLAFRVSDPNSNDGWRARYHEGHTAYQGGFPYQFWASTPNARNANRLALIALSADAGNAPNATDTLVVPDVSELDPYWARQFVPYNPLKVGLARAPFRDTGHFIFGFTPACTQATSLEWLNENPDRVLGLRVVSSEQGHLAHPGGPERPEVAGIDPNIKVFLIARAKGGHPPASQPDAVTVIVHEVSGTALRNFGFANYLPDLGEFSEDMLGLGLLEVDVGLGNPSAVNMHGQMVVPTTASVPEAWEGWVGPRG